MSYPIDRVQLFDRDMNPLRELAPSEVFSRVRTEEVNGEHALVIVTTRRLEEGWRALTVDGTGKWREWVLTEPDESHESGKTAIGTYRFVWSLQYDLTYSYFHDTEEGVSIGMGSDTQALVAAQHVLEGVAGWSVGPCDAPDIAKGTGCVFIRESAWSKLSKLVECSGVEVDSVIEVSNLYGVTARKLCLRSHVGNEDALLRFDWSRDLTGIRRTPDPGPYYCRVVPLGKGESEYADDDETTYEYPIDITEEPDGQGGFYPYYLQDDEAALAFRIKAGDGTYVYPTIAVTYSEDDPELLLNAALAELHDYTRPGVTYEADVVQLAQAGMDVRGVALGDEVQCVDYGFNPDAGLRIQGRVLKIEVDELSPETTTQLTIGQLRDSITDLMKDMGQSLDELQHNNDKITEQMRSMTTARYIDELLDRINAEINATGGYAYFVPGEGIITYDVAVADPLVGSEATQVVQVKGGSIRIANTKNTQFSGIDDWNWRTVFTANGINADLVTAVHVTSGFIGSATATGDYSGSGNYINFDTGETHLATQLTSRNLLRNGAFSLGTDYWTATTGVTLTVEDDLTYGHHLKAVQSYSGSSTRCFYPNTSTNFTHYNGVTYTLTFWAKASGNNKLTVSRAGNTTDRYLDDEDIGTEWKQYITTLESTGTGSLMFWLTNSGTLYLADVMLVVGNSSFGFSENPEDLGQEGILYRLTGGYVNEGLYINNGHLYMNASYIHGGTFVAGGANNVNGVIEVRNASGATICKFDKDGADINGKITSYRGEIGGFTIGETALYSSRTSLTGSANGVYVSTGGISTGNGTSWAAMANGHLYGGRGSSTMGYLSFDHGFNGSVSGYGPRLAGSGGIALLCGTLAIGGYTSMGSHATAVAGCTGTYNNIPTNFSASWNTHSISFSNGQTVSGLCQNLSITWSNLNMNFTKGILT